MVSCRGLGCKSLAGNVGADIQDQLATMANPYIEEDEVRHTFCCAFGDGMPAHCQLSFGLPLTHKWQFWASNPTVYWNIPAATNGCGSGGFLESVAASYSEGSGGFSGDVNEPITGYSFISACNAHDLCYNYGSGKAGCDIAFGNSMTQSCGSNSQCQNFADLYKGAVGVYGDPAYTEAGLTQECRDFKDDFNENCNGASGGGTSGT